MPQTIYTYDPEDGTLMGAADADESPLEEDVYLIPSNATTLVPPSILGGQVARFIDNAWLVETLPVPAPDPGPTLAQQKSLKFAEIEQAAEAAVAPITAAYPIAERDTWPIQEAEAVAWTANSTAPTPILNAIATARGQTLAAVAANVLTKAAAFKALAGATFGKRKAKRDLIDAATTAAELSAIAW